MRRALLISLDACLVTIHQARLIEHSDLAKLLHQEDMDGFEGHSLSDWLCLAFVESNFNISKVNENADGSFDYGIFQINSHYWCTHHQSHSENICYLECQETPEHWVKHHLTWLGTTGVNRTKSQSSCPSCPHPWIPLTSSSHAGDVYMDLWHETFPDVEVLSPGWHMPGQGEPVSPSLWDCPLCSK